jgi:hypothetical protein
MGEKWMDRVKRVYKEKKDKDPNYKYSQAMSDAKIGYVAEGVATVKPAKIHRAKKQKGGVASKLVPIASIPAPPVPAVIKGGKSRKNKKSRKSRKGGKAKKSRKRK